MCFVDLDSVTVGSALGVWGHCYTLPGPCTTIERVWLTLAAVSRTLSQLARTVLCHQLG